MVQRRCGSPEEHVKSRRLRNTVKLVDLVRSRGRVIVDTWQRPVAPLPSPNESRLDIGGRF
jgi:hypothetical protein